MSDLSSRGGCGCSTGCGCSNSCGCSGFGGSSCSWIWICGSSFFCAAVVETATDSWETTAVDVTMAADVVDLTTPACGSLSCCAAAADLVPTTVVADAITPVAVAIPADAKSESGVSSQGPLLCPGCQIF